MTEAELMELYRQHGYFLFRRALAFLGHEAAAQDAVQDVFVRALRAAKSFRGDANPKTWLCRICDNLCIDLLRRRPRVAEPSTDEPEEPALNPVQNDDREAILSAQRMMAKLDPESQRLAVLYFLDELTQEELAEELGLSR